MKFLLFTLKKPTAFGFIAILTLTSLAAASTVSFSDNFTPTASSQWNDYAGNWTTSSGTYYAQTANNDPYTITALPYDVTNYSLTVTVNDEGDLRHLLAL
jgi:hypothetical protein